MPTLAERVEMAMPSVQLDYRRNQTTPVAIKAHRTSVDHPVQNHPAALIMGAAFQFRLFPDGRSCFPLVTRNIEAICGVTADEIRDDADPFFQRIHPDDVDCR